MFSFQVHFEELFSMKIVLKELPLIDIAGLVHCHSVTCTVNIEAVSHASHSHTVSEQLKRVCKMCLDSLGVANHSRGHHPCTTAQSGDPF